MFACFGPSKRAASPAPPRCCDAESQATDEGPQMALKEAGSRISSLTQKLTQSAQREESMAKEVSVLQERERDLSLQLGQQQEKLEVSLQANERQAQQGQALQEQLKEAASLGTALQAQLEGKRRQASVYGKQVLELKDEVKLKTKQQEQLRSKYLKMQEAMKMLEEVVMGAAGISSGEAPVLSRIPSSHGGSAGSRLGPAAKPPTHVATPNPDIIAKRFIAVRQSANELRLSFAELSKANARAEPAEDPEASSLMASAGAEAEGLMLSARAEAAALTPPLHAKAAMGAVDEAALSLAASCMAAGQPATGSWRAHLPPAEDLAAVAGPGGSPRVAGAAAPDPSPDAAQFSFMKLAAKPGAGSPAATRGRASDQQLRPAADGAKRMVSSSSLPLTAAPDAAAAAVRGSGDGSPAAGGAARKMEAARASRGCGTTTDDDLHHEQRSGAKLGPTASAVAGALFSSGGSADECVEDTEAGRDTLGLGDGLTVISFGREGRPRY